MDENKYNPTVYLTVYTTNKILGLIDKTETIFTGSYMDWKNGPEYDKYKIIKETNDFDKGGHNVAFWVEKI